MQLSLWRQPLGMTIRVACRPCTFYGFTFDKVLRVLLQGIDGARSNLNVGMAPLDDDKA